MSSVPPFPAPPTSQPPTISHVKALVAAHPSLAVRIRAARGRSKAGAQKWVWTVEFDEEQEPVSMWRIDFARNGEGSLLTSDAKDSVMIFSTIVNVLGEMLNHLKGRGIKPDIIMIGAMKQKGHDRPGFYKKMIERLASKYGYKPRIKPLIKASILSSMHANGFKLDDSVIQFASLA